MTKAPTGNAAAKHRNKRTYRSPPVSFPPAIGRVLVQFSSVQCSLKLGRLGHIPLPLAGPTRRFSLNTSVSSRTSLPSTGLRSGGAGNVDYEEAASKVLGLHTYRAASEATAGGPSSRTLHLFFSSSSFSWFLIDRLRTPGNQLRPIRPLLYSHRGLWRCALHMHADHLVLLCSLFSFSMRGGQGATAAR
jgi:hypothetical protein